MKFFSRFTEPAKPATPGASAVNLDFLATSMFDGLNEIENQPVDLDLLRARLADHYRDMDRRPMVPDVFMAKAEALQAGEQIRLSLLIDGLNHEDFRHAFQRAVGEEVVEQIEHLFFNLARELSVLTPEVLLQSPLRREEMVRHFIARVGLGIEGETEEESRQRLERLDYGKLLSAAEKAKSSAEERMAYLQDLQDKQEELLGQRGKI